MNSRYCLFPAIGLVSFVSAWAQTTQPAPAKEESVKTEQTVELSVFEVTTSRDIGYQSTNAAEVTRMDTPISDIPMNVTVYNQQFIEDILAKDTNDILDYDASVNKRTENDGFIARGFTNVNANFLNGFRQTEGFGSQSVANVERVEVIKGPAAVLYGQGGFGAIVNRVTKRPLMTAKTSFRTVLGDHDTYRVEVDDTRPLALGGGKKFAYRFSGSWEDGYVYRGTPNQRLDLAPSFLWNITEKTQLVLEYIHSVHKRHGGWAFPMSGGNPDGIADASGTFHSYGARDFAHTIDGDLRENTRGVSAVDLRHAFNRNIQFRSQFQYESRDQKQIETQPEPLALTLLKDAVLMPRTFRNFPRDTKNYRTRNELVMRFRTGPLDHRILVGHAWDQQYDVRFTERTPNNRGGFAPGSANLEGSGRNSANGNAYNVYANLTLAEFIANPKLAGFNPNLILPINVFDPANSPAVPPVGQRQVYLDTFAKTVLENNEFYANEIMSFAQDRIFLQGGVRHTTTKSRSVNYLTGAFPNRVINPNAVEATDEADSTTFSTGIVWHLDAAKRLSLYGNMNSSFEPEFRNQPDGTPLDPLEGNQKEVGVKFNFLEERLQGLVSWFDITQDNVVIADPDIPDAFQQVSDQRSTGVEVGVNTRLTKSWMLFGGYAYTDARNERTGAPQFGQPRHSFRLFNRYSFNDGPLKGAYASVGALYGGDRPVELSSISRPEPEWVIPSYWRFDLILGYKLRLKKSRTDWDFAFKVKNLADNNDIFFVAQRDRFTPDPGREWEFYARLRF